MDARTPVGRRIGAVSAFALFLLTFSVAQPAQARDDSHSLAAAVAGLDLTAFGSKATIASSSAAIDGKTTARATAAGVRGSGRTLASARVTELNKRERAQQCLPELAMFKVLRVRMACGESRVQTVPALIPDDYRQPTGAALLGPVQPARERVPTTIDNGGPQAVGRGSVASVDIDDRRALEPSIDGLQKLLDALAPVGEQTVEAARAGIDPDLREVLEPLAASLGLRPSDKVGAVATVVGQLLAGTRKASLLASVRVGESSAQANSDEVKVVALAATGGGQIDVLPGFGSGGAPLMSIIVGPAKSVSTFDRATAGRTPTHEPAETRIMLGLPIAGDERAELLVRPGTPVTLLAGTPLETTVSASQGRSDAGPDGSVVSSVGPTRVQLLSGVKGGIKVDLGQIESAIGSRFDPEAEAINDAGMDGWLTVGAGSLLAASGLAVVAVLLGQRRASRQRSVGAE